MDKAEALLGVRPRVGLREGLDHTLAWVRAAKALASPAA